MTPTDTGSPLPPTPSSRAAAGWYLPWVFLAIAGLYLVAVFFRMNPPNKPFDVRDFARLPVVEGGRMKPLESVARVYLRMISHREEFVDENGDKQPAIRWYLDTLAGGSVESPGPVWKYKVFRIENDQLLAELKLTPREGLRYSLDEMKPQLGGLFDKARAADEKREGGKKLDLFETKALELARRIRLVLSMPRFRGMDTQDNKLLLLPPQSAGEEWKSLGEFRDSTLSEGVVAAMSSAQAMLLADPQRLDHLTDSAQREIVETMHNVNYDKLGPQDRAEAVQATIKMLRADPGMIPAEARRDWLLTVLSLLSKDEKDKVRDQMQKDTEGKLAANPAAVDWNKMVSAYRDDKPDEFNKQLKDYRDSQLHHLSGADLARVRLEATYDRFAPFYQCTGLYVFAFLLTAVGFILKAAEKPQWGDALRVSASRVLYLTLVVHTAALLVRMYLMDRPFVFVTNLYSSAIFIGWGCVVIGVVLERLYPIGIGNAIAAILGLSTTIVAHNLATEDTLEMMQAVLDTNFWLSTHVTTVTLGYTATFVAGFLGVLYVFQMLAAVIRESFESAKPPTADALLAFGAAAAGLVAIPLLLYWMLITALTKFEYIHSGLQPVLLFLAIAAGGVYFLSLLFLRATAEGVDHHGNPVAGKVPGIVQPVAGMALTPETGKVLSQMIYGIVCFATLLSFVGTVLGGIWADQSWGRFWGWDPKENGAVLIVLWNSLILHARWCGLVKERGMAVLAVVGNMITAWSWFGTNQLGIGLHAYGFDTRLADGCANFWLSQLIVIGLGLIPRQYWASATRRPATAPLAANVPNGLATAGNNPLSVSPNGLNGNSAGHSRAGKAKKADKRR